MNPDVTPDLNPANVSHLNDADMQAVPAALARAAVRARELAARTGTPLVVRRPRMAICLRTDGSGQGLMRRSGASVPASSFQPPPSSLHLKNSVGVLH